MKYLPHSSFLRSALRRLCYDTVLLAMIASMLLPTRLPACPGDDCDDCSDDSYDYWNEDCEGVNSFSIVNGNARRASEDLQLLGAATGKFAWMRYHNTMPRPGVAVFGVAGNWRHSWQYDLVETTGPQPQLELIYPLGLRSVFNPIAHGGWSSASKIQESIAATTDGYDISTPGGTQMHFVRKTGANGPRYDMTMLTDATGLVVRLDYDAQGNLTQVTEPAGRFFKPTYSPVSFQKGVWHRLGTITTAPAAGQWLEIAVPADLAQTPLQHLRLVGSLGSAIAIAELQFFAPGASTPLRGTANGTGSTPAALFDGDTTTVFRGDRTDSNVCGLELGASGKSAVARIRLLAAKGEGNTLTGAIIEGLEMVPTTRPQMSKVAASDGRTVNYDYIVLADPVSGQEFIALKDARYNDGTQANYSYDFVSANARPLLVEADDPRYDGRAKQIRYTYHDRLGMIHQEINSATGGVYASLELDKQDPLKRVVSYSDLRQVTVRLTSDAVHVATRTDSLGRATQFERDANGRVTAKTDHQGRRTERTFDANGNVTVERRDGRTERQVARDAKGHIVQATDRYGRTTQFERDANGRIAREVQPDGTAREFAYDALGRVTQQRDRDGALHKFAYDARGLKTAWTDPAGQTHRYTYDAFDRVVTVIDPLGRTITNTYNDRNLVTKTVLPDSTAWQSTYDSYGRKVAEIDSYGRVAEFGYDSLGRVVRHKDFAGGVTTYDYTELPKGCGSCTLASHPSRIVAADGAVTAFLYDTEARLLARTVAQGTDAQATTTYAYDLDNNLISVTDPLGNVTRYTYDDDHNRLTAADPLGRVTKWTYDARGNVLSQTTPDGGVNKSSYDIDDQRTATTDAAGNVTRYDYDDIGNLIALTDATGKKTRFAYDAKRRTAINYPDGKSQTWEYDAAGRVIKSTSPDGVVTATTYDTGNRVLTVSQSSQSSVSSTSSSTYSYDALGHRLTVTDPLGRVTKWTYDAHGNVLSQTAPDGTTTSYQYDSQDRRIASTDALGKITHFAYDAANNRTSLTDANGNTYKFTFDALHRRTAMVYPDGSQEKWTYDLAGQLTAYVNRSGQNKTVSYNAAGQPISETWTAAAGPQPLSPSLPYALLPSLPGPTSYTYDSAGRLIKIDNGQAKLTYDYDGAGRLTSEMSDLSALVRGLDPQTVSYSYDELGRSAGLKYPDRTQVSYDYDSQGRLTTISDGPGQPLATYAYDSLGRIAQLSRDNGVVTTYGYDAAGQLLEIMNLLGRTTLASSEYTLDAAGRRTAQTREDGIAEKYGYDVTGQLTSVDYGLPVGSSDSTSTSNLNQAVLPRSEAFSYDPVGNRMQAIETPNAKSQNPNVVTYTTNNLNQYTKVANAAFAYDANGNLVDDGKQTYRYDAQNRLISIEPSLSFAGNVRAEFFYDARNRCVLRRYYTKNSQNQWVLDNANSRALTYDNAWNLLTERTLDGQQVGEYIHGLRTDEILVANLATSTSTSHFNPKLESVYPLIDGLGSTVALVDDHGSVTQRYRYEAYGTPHILSTDYRPSSTGSTYRFLFTGREWLAQVGLNDHRYRYYLTCLERWLDMDPIRFSGGLNLYRYVENDTINNIDPFGLADSSQVNLTSMALSMVFGNNSKSASVDVPGSSVGACKACSEVSVEWSLSGQVEASSGLFPGGKGNVTFNEKISTTVSVGYRCKLVAAGSIVDSSLSVGFDVVCDKCN